MKKEMLAEMGMRIRDRRTELDMSQAELARRAGYTNRSIETRIEKGEVDLTTSKIEVIANILETTPAYLLGWEDKEDKNVTMARFYRRYEELPELERAMVRKIMGCDENFNKV